MHSRHARNLYDSKIKRIFEIVWTLFEIILFIHFYPLKKAPGQSQKHFMKIFLMDYCLPLQICTFGPNFFWFSSWHFLTHAWKSKLLRVVFSCFQGHPVHFCTPLCTTAHLFFQNTVYKKVYEILIQAFLPNFSSRLADKKVRENVHFLHFMHPVAPVFSKYGV